MATDRESEQMLRSVQNMIRMRNFGSEAELQQFLNDNLTGRPMEEIIDKLKADQPDTELEKAERMMADLATDASPSVIRRTARAALGLAPECMAAWLTLGLEEREGEAALKVFDEGIGHGRVRFAGLIASMDNGGGLWGWVEARDFMRLLEQRALELQTLSRLEDAMVAYQEMLDLNPHDNQGIRGQLLLLLIAARRLPEARALVARFPNDILPDILFGSAFLAILEAVDATGYELPDMDEPDGAKSPPAVVKRLGPEFDLAKKALKRATDFNPFVALVMFHPQMMGVALPTHLAIGGPYEAIAYSQEWAPLWHVSGLPMVMLTAAAPLRPLRAAKSERIKAELIEAVENLESLDDEPWWDSYFKD